MGETFSQGGVLMYPLAACSVLAVWVILDRAWHLQRARVVRSEIVTVIDTLSGPEDVPLARSICARHPGPFAALVQVALEGPAHSREELR